MFKKTLLLLLLLLTQEVFAEPAEVVVTIKPLHALVQGVMGDTAKAALLLDFQSPHDFQLQPSQIKIIQQAKIIFYIDDHLETFLARVLKTIPQHVSKMSMMSLSGLVILSIRQNEVWHETQHHDQYNHGVRDNHIWLDPDNAKIMVNAIVKALSIIYPEQQKIYRANADNIIQRIEVLDNKINLNLEEARDNNFIVFHDAYQYFEKHYGLSSVGAISLNFDGISSPARIKALRMLLQQKDIACIFLEPQSSYRLIHVVIEKTTVKIGKGDPLGITLKPKADLYFELLDNLASELQQCLGDGIYK